MNNVSNIIGWFTILGVPTIFTMTAWCVKKCISFAKQLSILMKAQKAQMRSQLLNQYYIHEEKGWIRIEDLDDWENQYKAYHDLVGPNGVLDKKRDILLGMPNSQN